MARYRRMAGDETHFLTGTDEHGQNIERAARKEGIAPIELADRIVADYHACATGWASPTTTSSAPPSSGTSRAWRR